MAMDLGIKPIMNPRSGARNAPAPIAPKGSKPSVFALDSAPAAKAGSQAKPEPQFKSEPKHTSEPQAKASSQTRSMPQAKSAQPAKLQSATVSAPKQQPAAHSLSTSAASTSKAPAQSSSSETAAQTSAQSSSPLQAQKSAQSLTGGLGATALSLAPQDTQSESDEITADSAGGVTTAPVGRPQQTDYQAPFESAEPFSKNSIEPKPTQTLQAMAKVQTATRQAAMQIFLDKMQNELGVDPARVVEAFSKLSPEELMSAPEESSADFIKQLSLDPSQSKKALGLYNEMLSMMAATGMAQYLAKNGQSAAIHVEDKAQANLKELRSSIGKMDDKFFMNGQFAPQAANAQAAYAAQANSQNALNEIALNENDGANDPLSNFSADDKNSLDPAAKNLSNNGKGTIDVSKFQQAAAATTATMTPAELAALVNQNEQMAAASGDAVAAESDDGTESVLKKLLSDGGIKAASSPMATSTAMVDKANVSAPSAADVKTTTAAATAAAAGNSIVQAKSSDQSGAGANGDGSKKSDDLNNGQLQQNQQAQVKNGEAGKAFNVEAPKNISTAEVQANVKELISQAQFLSRRGGGEMKISLNPDGLGEVNLKVKMQNGQVNVEMVASSDEAKHMLEKGLGELKQAFASHKLNLDSVRIDTPKDASNNFSQQRQEQERGFQQKFLGDFQDRNGMNRREMFEYPGPAVPSSQRHDESSNAKAYATNKRRDVSRRLDLVA